MVFFHIFTRFVTIINPFFGAVLVDSDPVPLYPTLGGLAKKIQEATLTKNH